MTSAGNRELFERMLRALGTKDFDGFEACLHPDVLLEWPYEVMPGYPGAQRGAAWFRDVLTASWRDFEPFAYRIEVIHDLARPDGLIAEYTSHSRYLPTGKPYSNRYVGMIDFADGLITRWREYVNPMIIADVVGGAWREPAGADHG